MGLFDGIKSFFGQQPGAVTPGATTPAPWTTADGSGLLQAPTQAPSTSFLDRLGTPDSRGLNFGDKLFAAGSILQGDSGGAASYLQNQRAQADVLGERARTRDLSAKGSEALRNSLNPDGTLNFKAYLAAMGPNADPATALKLEEQLAPSYATMSGPRGQLTAINKRNPRDFFEVQPAGPAPIGMIDPETGGLNPLYFQGIEAKAAAERKGKPLAPRAPARGRAGARPKSYGLSDVTFEGG